MLGMFFDPEAAASRMGCGGVLENILLSASTMGLEASFSTIHDAESPERVARIRLVPADINPDPLAGSISERGTDRGHYRRWIDIEQQTFTALQADAAIIPTARVHWFQEKRQRRGVTRLITAADRLRFSHETVHREFYEKLRFGEEADRLADGLAADTLGVERIFLPVLKRLRPWALTKWLNRFGLHYIMALRGAWVPLVSANAVGALVIAREADHLAAGRALQRLWLSATAHGLLFQPLGALPLFLIRLHELKGAGFDGRQLAKLRSLEEALTALIPQYDPGVERLIMLFRVGHGPRPKARSRRRPVDSFIVESSESP